MLAKPEDSRNPQENQAMKPDALEITLSTDYHRVSILKHLKPAVLNWSIYYRSNHYI